MVKRFISGAVCPKCGQQDAIRAERDEDNNVMNRDCVECGFEDALYDTMPSEIQTRVTPADPLDQIEAQPIKIQMPDTRH